MRSGVVLAIMLSVAACSEPDPPMLRQVSVWAPGLEITIDGRGSGQFLKRLSGEQGRFSLTSKQFDDLARRMEVFRRSPEVIAGKDMPDFVLHGARCGGPSVTDAGGISFHWLGPSVDQFYSVDYGCDPERSAARNSELRAILKSLPVPEPDTLP